MIVYYISSHGFGHAVRACEVIRHLPADLPLTLRTGVPEWFLREELGTRSFDLHPAVFDCGALGPDSTQIDLEMTMGAMEQMLGVNQRRLEDEIALLKRIGARVVVSNIVPFALRAAAMAGLRSVLIGNFSWPGIYGALAAAPGVSAALRARSDAVIAAMQNEYALGDLLLVPGMAIPIEACRTRRDVPIIARRGLNRRRELCTAMGLDPEHRVVLVYLGRDGMEAMDWSGLDGGTAQYVTFGAATQATNLLRAIPAGILKPGDACASVDAVVAKTGYGICGECIAAGTPLLYPPREQFAEYGVIHALMQAWGGGLCLDEKRFKASRWAEPLEQLIGRRGGLSVLDTNGAAISAAEIVSFINNCSLMKNF